MKSLHFVLTFTILFYTFRSCLVFFFQKCCRIFINATVSNILTPKVTYSRRFRIQTLLKAIKPRNAFWPNPLTSTAIQIWNFRTLGLPIHYLINYYLPFCTSITFSILYSQTKSYLISTCQHRAHCMASVMNMNCISKHLESVLRCPVFLCVSIIESVIISISITKSTLFFFKLRISQYFYQDMFVHFSCTSPQKVKHLINSYSEKMI